MQSNIRTDRVSKTARWAGYAVGFLPALLLIADGGAKLFKPAPVVEATARLGYPESAIVGMGIALLGSTILYVIPRTCVLGAILLTGYLGGAAATHVRVGNSPFNILFPVFLGVLLWGGLYLRDTRLRSLIPLRTTPHD